MEIVKRRTEADAVYALFIVTKKCLEMSEMIESGARSSMMTYIENMVVLQKARARVTHSGAIPEPFFSLIVEKIDELEKILAKSYLPPVLPLSGRVLRSGKVC